MAHRKDDTLYVFRVFSFQNTTVFLRPSGRLASRLARLQGPLIVPDNVTLVPLPPYSPELNPVEHVWLYLKARYLSHRLHPDYDAIADAASGAWNRLIAETPHIALLVPLDFRGQMNGGLV